METTTQSIKTIEDIKVIDGNKKDSRFIMTLAILAVFIVSSVSTFFVFKLIYNNSHQSTTVAAINTYNQPNQQFGQQPSLTNANSNTNLNYYNNQQNTQQYAPSARMGGAS